jgi:hypothetical protein
LKYYFLGRWFLIQKNYPQFLIEIGDNPLISCVISLEKVLTPPKQQKIGSLFSWRIDVDGPEATRLGLGGEPLYVLDSPL